MTRPSAHGSQADWLGRLLDVARITKSASGVAPFPFIKAIASVLVDLLEIVQSVVKNTTDLSDTLESALDILVIIRDDSIAHGDVSPSRYKRICLEFTEYLNAIVEDLNKMRRRNEKTILKYFRNNSIRIKIDTYNKRVEKIRANFTLLTVTDTRSHVAHIQENVRQVTDRMEEVNDNVSRLGDLFHQDLSALGSQVAQVRQDIRFARQENAAGAANVQFNPPTDTPLVTANNQTIVVMTSGDSLLSSDWFHMTFDTATFLRTACYWLPSLLWDYSITSHIPEMHLIQWRCSSRNFQTAEAFREFVTVTPIPELRRKLPEWFLGNCYGYLLKGETS